MLNSDPCGNVKGKAWTRHVARINRPSSLGEPVHHRLIARGGGTGLHHGSTRLPLLARVARACLGEFILLLFFLVARFPGNL